MLAKNKRGCTNNKSHHRLEIHTITIIIQFTEK